MKIYNEELEKAAKEYVISADYPETEQNAFEAGAMWAKLEFDKVFLDIICENQGLKLYKDNELKRFKQLAVEFTNWIAVNNFMQYQDKLWSTDLAYYSGCVYTTEELFKEFELNKNKNGLVNS